MGGPYKISILHIIFLSMITIGLKNHVTILPAILETAKRDGWISVILAGISIFPWLLWMIYIQNKSELKPIKDWLPERIGKIPAKILFAIFIAFAYVLAAFTLRETILWMTSTFLDNTPIPLLIFMYAILCFLLVSTSIQAIVTANALIFFFVIVFGFYVAITNMQVKNYDLLFPMLEHGMGPVVHAMIFPASGFIELFLFLFLQHHFKNPLKWYHIAIVMFCFTGLTMGPLIGAITEFGPEEAAKQHYPAYEEWALVTLGRFIEHLDFLSVHQWLSGTLIRVGIILFIVCDILNFAGQPKKIWSYMVPPFLFINFILYIIEDEVFLRLNNYYFLEFSFYFIFLMSIILIIIALTAKKTPRRFTQQQTNNESSDHK